MDPVTNLHTVADEIASYARQNGLDTEPLRIESMFQTEHRWIFFWRKIDALPCSGPADELEGTLHYNMQGDISVPAKPAMDPDSDYVQALSEAGVLENLDQAFELLKAWLIDQKDVAELPTRHVRRQCI